MTVMTIVRTTVENAFEGKNVGFSDYRRMRRYAPFIRASENSGKSPKQIQANFNRASDCSCITFGPLDGFSRDQMTKLYRKKSNTAVKTKRFKNI